MGVWARKSILLTWGKKRGDLRNIYLCSPKLNNTHLTISNPLVSDTPIQVNLSAGFYSEESSPEA